MNYRETNGLILAATTPIKRHKGDWVVPSQTRKGAQYLVNLNGHESCTCLDHETRRVKCKHIYAVEFTMQREIHANGHVTETRTVRLTYRQDWPAYNAAQTNEAERFAGLLHNLCEGITQPPHKGRGRPSLPLAGVVFGAACKVYSTMSGRRAMSDLKEWEAKGYLGRAPHYNSIFDYLETPRRDVSSAMAWWRRKQSSVGGLVRAQEMLQLRQTRRAWSRLLGGSPW